MITAGYRRMQIAHDDIDTGRESTHGPTLAQPLPCAWHGVEHSRVRGRVQVLTEGEGQSSRPSFSARGSADSESSSILHRRRGVSSGEGNESEDVVQH